MIPPIIFIISLNFNICFFLVLFFFLLHILQWEAVMANYREIVTKAIVSKGKKLFTSENSVVVENPSTILGCWIINHNFHGVKKGNDIQIEGNYDVNIWYSYDNDSKTNVVKEVDHYQEVVHMRDVEGVSGEEIMVRSLKQPNCVKAEIQGNTIHYVVEKELGIELLGDVKVKVETAEEDPWDDIAEEKSQGPDDTIQENFIEETI